MPLSPDLLKTFQEQGYLFPLPALDEDQQHYFRAQVQRLLDDHGGRLEPASILQPHLHFPWAHQLAVQPRVLEMVTSILGPDLLIHSTSLFCKLPGEPTFASMHQDGYYWKLSDPSLVSAWIALTPSGTENGCMEVVPGSHRQGRQPHYEERHPHNMLATGLTISAGAAQKTVPVCLPKGSMSLHHVDLLHRSGPNNGDGIRIGFAIRYLRPGVSQELPHHPVVLACGKDSFRHYTHQSQPPQGSFEQCLSRAQAFSKTLRKRRLK